MKKFILSCVLLATSVPALAQTASTFSAGPALSPSGVDAALGTKADYLGYQNVPVLPSIAALRSYARPATVSAVTVASYYAGGTTGGGMFYYLPSDTTAQDNDGTIIVNPATGARWHRDTGYGAINPMWFGCIGDGSSPDGLCLTAALAAAAFNTLDLGAHLYKTSLSLTSSSTVKIRGSNSNGGIYGPECTSGFVAGAANMTLLTLTGNNSDVGHVCFQMAKKFGTNTSGSAIVAGVSTQISIHDDQIDYPYIGVDVTGRDRLQNAATLVQRIVVISPSNGGAGIRVGVNSTGASTADPVIYDNHIIGVSSNTADGTLIKDAGGLYYRGNDIFQLGNGMHILPGRNQEVAVLYAYEVLGDSSYQHDLLIDTADSTGVVKWFNATNTWTSSATAANVLVQNTAHGTIGHISFVQHQAVIHPGGSSIGMDFESGSDISVQDSTICSAGDGGGQTGVKLGRAVTAAQIQNNRISDCGSKFGTGLAIETGANILLVTGNHFNATTTPITYAANGETAVIRDNMGVDNIQPTIASAPTLVLPVNPTVLVSGTSTVNVIKGAWSNRTVRLMAVTKDGFSLAAGTPGGACAAITLPQFHAVTLTYAAGLSCWMPG